MTGLGKMTLGVNVSEIPTINRFWMVYGIGRYAPTVQHPNKESAHKEAMRLAEANPGTSFVVLKGTSAYHADKPSAKRLALADTDFAEVPDEPYF